MEFTLDHNNNETDEHFALKLAAWKWLEDKSQIIGTESSDDNGGRIDVAGIKIDWGTKRVSWKEEWRDKKFVNSKQILTSEIEGATLRRVEAKASRSDFSRQFGNFGDSTSNGDPRKAYYEGEETGIIGYSYIITQSGMFEREEIPSGYGWLEVDIKNGHLYPECKRNPNKEIIPTPHGLDHKVLSWVRRLSWSASSRMARMFRVSSEEE